MIYDGNPGASNRKLLSPIDLDREKARGENRAMEREHVLAILRDQAPMLKAIGVLSVSVFGSTARGDAGPHSDVDVAVRLADSFSSGGFDYFGRLDNLEQELSRLLGCRVDVVAEPLRKKLFQHEIDRDRVLAF